MTEDAALQPLQPSLPGLPSLAETANDCLRASKAPNTLRAYRADLADFVLWCTEHHLEHRPASPETLCLYVTALAESGAKVSTIQRRLAAISQAHQLAGIDPSPTTDWVVRSTMAGIRRRLGVAPSQMAAVITPDLRQLLTVTPDDTLAGIRDRALLLLGFAGAFRRTELVSLDVEDLTETDDGLRVLIKG